LEEAWDRPGVGWWGPEVSRKKAVKGKRKAVGTVGTQLISNRITNEKKSGKNDTTTINNEKQQTN
jgi:hypothetical protein